MLISSGGDYLLLPGWLGRLQGLEQHVDGLRVVKHDWSSNWGRVFSPTRQLFSSGAAHGRGHQVTLSMFDQHRFFFTFSPFKNFLLRSGFVDDGMCNPQCKVSPSYRA